MYECDSKVKKKEGVMITNMR